MRPIDLRHKAEPTVVARFDGHPDPTEIKCTTARCTGTHRGERLLQARLDVRKIRIDRDRVTCETQPTLVFRCVNRIQPSYEIVSHCQSLPFFARRKERRDFDEC